MTSFYAVATRSTRVRAVFSEPMLENPALVDPTQYVLTDMAGSLVSILTAAVEPGSQARAMALTLGSELEVGALYQLKVLAAVVAAADQAPVQPNAVVFTWLEHPLTAEIPLEQFSGEVVGGLYGIHSGLVFFSPALESPAANSIIQIEQVDVCTKAYDEYHVPPQPGLARVLMTHGAGVVQTLAVTTLNSADVLWTKFPHLEAKFDLHFTGAAFADVVSPPVDGLAVATLQQVWPPDRVALLNNAQWKLRDNLGTPPAYFMTADNHTPFPVVPPFVIPL